MNWQNILYPASYAVSCLACMAYIPYYHIPLVLVYYSGLDESLQTLKF
jgi:hypothetical protein